MIYAEDIMVDLETLGVTPNSHILSIGACTMDRSQTFYKAIGLQQRNIDFDTVRWWLKQSDKAQDVFNHCAQAPALSTVLRDFTDWFKEVGDSDSKIWGHGATFDVSMLENAYRGVGQNIPWAFWNVRDTRTLIDTAVWVTGNDQKPERKGTHHNALDDAVFQVEWMASIQRALAEVRK